MDTNAHQCLNHEISLATSYFNLYKKHRTKLQEHLQRENELNGVIFENDVSLLHMSQVEFSTP